MFKKIPLIILGSAALILSILVGVIADWFQNQALQKTFSSASDFSWVKGELEWNPLEGGFWQIRFGKELDPYGGKFVLGNDPKLRSFKEGDLVLIRGQVAKEQVSIWMAGWIYEIEKIELLE